MFTHHLADKKQRDLTSQMPFFHDDNPAISRNQSISIREINNPELKWIFLLYRVSSAAIV